MLGPLFYYDLVRLARQGRTTLVRVLYLAALLVALAVVYAAGPPRGASINDYAAWAAGFAAPVLLLQYALVLVLAPIYFGMALTEEKERGTLDLLFASQLTDRDLVLGKLGARAVQLGGVVLAGLPVLALVQLWGGVDVPFLVSHLAGTLLLLLSAGTCCLWLSAESTSSSDAVLRGYGVMILIGGRVVSWTWDELSAAAGAGLVGAAEALGGLCLWHAGAAALWAYLAVRRLRSLRRADRRPHVKPRSASGPQAAVPPRPDKDQAPSPTRRRRPIPDNALFWKECQRDTPLEYTSALPDPALCVGTALFLVLGWAAYWGVWAIASPDVRSSLSWVVWAGSGMPYATFVGLHWLGVAFAAARTIVRERERRTLDALLLLPVGRGELFFYKWLGTCGHCLAHAPLVAAPVLFLVGCGELSLGAAGLLLLGPWPVLLLLSALGLYVSARCRTVLGAEITVAVVLCAVLAGHLFAASLTIDLTGPRPDWNLAAAVGATEVLLCLPAAGVLGVLAWRRFAALGAEGSR